MADFGGTAPIEAPPIVDRRGREPHGGKGKESASGQGDTPAPQEPHSIADAVSIMGIDANEVTPGVQRALTHIMEEFDRVRIERDHLRDQNHYLHELADSHPFLPVINRRALQRELSGFLARSEQPETAGAFLYLDMTNLADVRRRQGQAAADQALIKAANVIKQHTRASDVIGSMDAGDFGVVLTLIDPATAADKVGEIVAAIERGTGEGYAGQHTLRVRAGLHIFGPTEEAHDIIEAADRAARPKPGA